MNIAAGRTEAQIEKGPRLLMIPDHKDVIVGELAERGEWIVANIRTDGWWPVNAPAYAFLSFFRVLEVAFSDSKRRQKWVSANTGSVHGHGVADALAGLRLKGVTDIGAHLYESGRCAIAHANRTPIVDPDDPADTRRLQSELPIMMALAKKAIEEELGIETSQTVYQRHLYELAGFKKIFGPDTVAYLTRGEQITDRRMLSIPYVSVRIRKRPPYAPLSNLRVKEIAQTGKVFHIRFESKSGDVAIRFQLDFGAERLNFSIFHDLGVKDTGTPESAETIAEVRRFENEYLGNGQLHIVDADTGDLIARKDAYIPVNMFLDQDAADAEVTGAARGRATGGEGGPGSRASRPCRQTAGGRR